MRRTSRLPLNASPRARLTALLLTLAAALPGGAHAQRHAWGAAPPTAPNHLAPPGSALPMAPIAPVSSGMGPIQFQAASQDVPAPQVLTRQLNASDERARAGALASLGAPGQYLAHGRVPFPHSVQLDLTQLGPGGELDSLLTVELDQHILTAVLVPDGDNWRRIATLTFATSFSNITTTPATFVRPLRAWLQPDRYRAVFHASVTSSAGDFTENEADLRIVNGRALVVLDFVSGARQCDTTGQLRPAHQSCEILQRWLEPDPADPMHRFVLITGVGHFSAEHASDPLLQSRNYRLTRLRTFTCQPFVFSEATMHFQPTANASSCFTQEHPNGERTGNEHPGEHPASEHP